MIRLKPKLEEAGVCQENRTKDTTRTGNSTYIKSQWQERVHMIRKLINNILRDYKLNIMH